MPDLFQRLRRNLERDESVRIATPAPEPEPEDERPIPHPPASADTCRDAEPEVDYKAQAESLLRQSVAKDRRIAELEAALAAAQRAAAVPLPVDPVDRIDGALDANLRESNQRLRANLRAAEAMLALRDGVGVDELTVPWPKQTPSRAATRA